VTHFIIWAKVQRSGTYLIAEGALSHSIALCTAWLYWDSVWTANFSNDGNCLLFLASFTLVQYVDNMVIRKINILREQIRRATTTTSFSSCATSWVPAQEQVKVTWTPSAVHLCAHHLCHASNNQCQDAKCVSALTYLATRPALRFHLFGLPHLRLLLNHA
jgi:hypothetical protein